LFLVDIRKAVHQVESSQISELCNEAQGFVASPHVELVEPQPIIHPLEIVIVILPPLVEISVRKFEDRGGESVPSLVQVDQQIHFVVLELHGTDLDGVEESGVEQFFLVEVQDSGQIQVENEVTGLEAEFPHDDWVTGEPVANDEHAIDHHEATNAV